MAHIIGLLLFSFYITAALSLSLPTDEAYYGGIVEIPWAQSGTPAERLAENLKQYLSLLGTDTAQFADILLFPEGTLNSVDTPTVVPNPLKETVVPCDDANAETYEQFLVQLSCEAKRLAIYLVINLTEKEKCLDSAVDPRPCASSGFNIFNTNVVFDRKGAVISRYRKVNLYDEMKNVTYVPEIAMFDTDFGVRFGHFICFDILFYTPAQKMVEDYGITDFLFPSMWYAQLPFLTAAQTQASWAFGNNVNLLAAGASNPANGSTGSGGYGRNIMSSWTVHKEPVSVISVVRVPKATKRQTRAIPEIVRQTILKPNNAKLFATPTVENVTTQLALTQDSVNFKRDNMELYETMPVNLTAGSRLQQTLCYNNTKFCCDFDIQWSRYVYGMNDTKYYTYRLGIYDGWRDEQTDSNTNKLRNCALFSCIGNELADCGKVFPAADIDNVKAQVIFTRITINGLFPKATEYFLMPNSLKDDLLPLFISDYELSAIPVDTEDGPKLNVTYRLKRSIDNLLTFAIYGNYYNGTDLRNAAPLSVASIALLLIATITAIF